MKEENYQVVNFIDEVLFIGKIHECEQYCEANKQRPCMFIESCKYKTLVKSYFIWKEQQ